MAERGGVAETPSFPGRLPGAKNGRKNAAAMLDRTLKRLGYLALTAAVSIGL